MTSLTSLTVELNYPNSEQGAPVVLPFRVLDAEGALLAEGATRSASPVAIDVPDAESPLYVRLTWPSGRTETKRVDPEGKVNFSDEQMAHSEWSTWALPRLNPNSALIDQLSMVRSQSSRSASTDNLGIGHHSDNWMRLWRFASGAWSEVLIEPRKMRRDNNAIQLELQLDSAGWCLQLGGPRIPWVLVSLPGCGPCRILITPNDSTNPSALALKVVVTGFRSDAETLMEFLCRDAMRAARSVADVTGIALDLINGKYSDPISATAGAYYLLRTNGWRSIPDQWLDNLSNDFPWLADGAIIRCAAWLRSGVEKDGRDRARQLLIEAISRRGAPVFAESLSLMQEAASLLQPLDRKTDKAASTKISDFAASKAWAGAAFSFLGSHPDEPSPVAILGTPGKTRPASSERLTFFSQIVPEEQIIPSAAGA